MNALLLHGRRSLELQKWRNFRVSVKLLQNAFSAFSNSFSSAAAGVSLQDGRKGKTFTVSYLVNSLGLTKNLAESISRKVGSQGKGNPDSVLNLLISHGFTDSQISSIVTDYPLLFIVDAEKSLGPKLQFLQSRGASSSELAEIVSKVPKILRMKEGKASSRYYDFVKEIIEADKSSKFEKLCYSLPEGSKQANVIKNASVLRELGMPQKLLFPLLISNYLVSGKERFEESLKKVLEMGFDPTTPKFVDALRVFYGFSDKTLEEKVSAYKRIGFAVEDVWTMFKKYPIFLAHSEKKILNSTETFLGLGFSRDEFVKMIKRHPQCLNLTAETVKKKIEFLVKKMNWPLMALVSNPQVIGLSMEKRIVPRCNVIKALISKGLVKRNSANRSELPPVQCFLFSTNQDFLNKYVMKHDDKQLVAELMAIFTGDHAS